MKNSLKIIQVYRGSLNWEENGDEEMLCKNIMTGVNYKLNKIKHNIAINYKNNSEKYLKISGVTIISIDSTKNIKNRRINFRWGQLNNYKNTTKRCKNVTFYTFCRV